MARMPPLKLSRHLGVVLHPRRDPAPVVEKLTNEDIVAISAYVASLDP